MGSRDCGPDGEHVPEAGCRTTETRVTRLPPFREPQRSRTRYEMAALTSVQQIDLTPLPGKTYFSIDREWREEFIYFLLVDRFHDDSDRTPPGRSGRSRG